MNTQRLPWILVGMLTVLNVAVLATLWLRGDAGGPPHQGPPRHDGPPHHGGLPHEIGMTPEQQERVRPLGEAHFAKLHDIRDQIIALRVQAFADFGKAGEDSAAALDVLRRIGALQVSAEVERYHHFHELLRFCTPEQAVHFQEILPQVLSRKGQPENRDNGPPHGGPGGPPPPH